MLRCLAAAVVIMGAHWAIEGVRRQSAAVAAQAASFEVEPLPLILGDWIGVKMETDADIVREVGALKMVERLYENDRGQKVGVIVATFPTGVDVLPHPPDLCYRGAGWDIRGDVWCEAASGRRYKQLQVERPGTDVALITYWYQLRAEIASNRHELRQVLQKLRRARQTWPPLVKVMIHAPVEFSETEAKSASEELGEEIYRWIAEEATST